MAGATKRNRSVNPAGPGAFQTTSCKRTTIPDGVTSSAASPGSICSPSACTWIVSCTMVVSILALTHCP